MALQGKKVDERSVFKLIRLVLRYRVPALLIFLLDSGARLFERGFFSSIRLELVAWCSQEFHASTGGIGNRGRAVCRIRSIRELDEQLQANLDLTIGAIIEDVYLNVAEQAIIAVDERIRHRIWG